MQTEGPGVDRTRPFRLRGIEIAAYGSAAITVERSAGLRLDNLTFDSVRQRA